VIAGCLDDVVKYTIEYRLELGLGLGLEGLRGNHSHHALNGIFLKIYKNCVVRSKAYINTTLTLTLTQLVPITNLNSFDFDKEIRELRGLFKLSG
jgi:hypothetical protein